MEGIYVLGRKAIGQQTLDPTSSTSISSFLVRPTRLKGTAQDGGASTITLASGSSTSEDAYVGYKVKITGGTGAGQTRRITGHVGSTLVSTVHAAWLTNPDNTSKYELISPFEDLEAQYAIIKAEIGDVNVTLDGSTPTATSGTNVGLLLAAGESMVIENPDNIRSFKCIVAVAGSGGKVKVVTMV